MPSNNNSYNSDRLLKCLLHGPTCIIDFHGCLKYAEGCYKFECYEEVYCVCSKLIEYIDEYNEHIKCQANLLKGKAVFYSYQRKIMYYMVNKSAMAKHDERRLIKECFQSIAEAINLLGVALDKMYIDEEGSRLLDWAMMDCIRETNWLNQCNRCLLCRRPCRLCRSHVFPRFLFDHSDGDPKEKIYVFGQNKHRLKSAGECWVWLCCRRCESIMTQNAESEFSKRFRSSGTVEYTSWLFNYCCTILFRTLSCVKFPLTFNDDEVYDAFLSCRKHLLSLPVKMKGVDHAAPTEMENYQLQLLSQVVTKEIQPFLFIIPSNISFERNEFEGVHILEQGLLGANTLCFLSVRRLIDGRKDLARLAHFFAAYSYGMIILLQFSPSAQCVLPERYRISRQSGTYTIPEAKEAVELIPKGLWELHHSCSLEYFESITEALQQLTSHAADKMISAGAFSMIPDEVEDYYISEYEDRGTGSETTGTNVPKTESTNAEHAMTSTHEMDYDTLTVPFPLSVDKPQLSMLPPGFKIVKSSKSLRVPVGHQIVLHDIENSGDLTVFVAVGDSGNFALDHPYIVYLFDSSERTHTYADGGFIAEVGEEIYLTKFLMEHSIYAKSRVQLKQIEERAKALLKPLLHKNRFLSLQMLVHYVKCRWSIKDTENLPSLGLKCSPGGCWYCQLLCQYCMKPALWINVQDVSTDNQYKFCSKKCSEMFSKNPSEMPKDFFTIEHCDEFLEGKLSGCTVLDIVSVCKEEGNTYNTIEVLSLCLGEHSDDLSRGHYILWQVRFIDLQYFRSFSITKDCTPLKILWSNVLDSEVFTLQEAYKLQPHLSRLVKRSVKELGYKDMATYIENFSSAAVNK